MADARRAIQSALCISQNAPFDTTLPEPLARVMLGSSVERMDSRQIQRLTDGMMTIGEVIDRHVQIQWRPIAEVAALPDVSDDMAAAAIQVMIRPNATYTSKLQQSLRASGFPVKVDGIMGKRTLEAMAGIMPKPTSASFTPPPSVASDATDIKSAIVEYCHAAGLPDDAIAMCIAHATAESGLNWKLCESPNYRSAERIRLVFGARTNSFSDDDLLHLAGSTALFEAMYGYRTSVGRGMGNTSPGDGEKYFGRGLLQLTGKENYQKAATFLGVDLVNNPQLVVTDLNVALGCVVYAWKFIINPTNKIISFMETYERLSGGKVGNHPQRRESYAQRLNAYESARTFVAGARQPVFV